LNEQSIARRYAKAIFELADESKALDNVAEELALTREIFLRTPEIFSELTSPTVGRDQKLALIEKLLAEARFDPTVANALRLLAERHRLNLLPAIAESYARMLDDHKGRLHSRVVSACPLPQSDLQEIARRLSLATNREVVMDASVDPELLGGLTVEIAGKTIDGSVRGQLNALGRQLRAS